MAKTIGTLALRCYHCPTIRAYHREKFYVVGWEEQAVVYLNMILCKECARRQ